MLYLVVSVLSLFIGISITIYLKHDNRGFELFMKSIHIFAFYRCFGKSSEAAVRHHLVERREALRKAFTYRDKVRDHVREYKAQYPEGWYDEARKTLDEKDISDSEELLIQRQQEYDYAVGLAFMIGFGKVTSKVLAEKTAA